MCLLKEGLSIRGQCFCSAHTGSAECCMGIIFDDMILQEKTFNK